LNHSAPFGLDDGYIRQLHCSLRRPDLGKKGSLSRLQCGELRFQGGTTCLGNRTDNTVEIGLDLR
jgi:hypothetical protein